MRLSGNGLGMRLSENGLGMRLGGNGLGMRLGGNGLGMRLISKSAVLYLSFFDTGSRHQLMIY